MRLCNLRRLVELGSADSDADPVAVAGAAGSAAASGHVTPTGYKRHASWAHLPGMEDRISEALARQRFLRPRLALHALLARLLQKSAASCREAVLCCSGPVYVNSTRSHFVSYLAAVRQDPRSTEAGNHLQHKPNMSWVTARVLQGSVVDKLRSCMASVSILFCTAQRI